VGLANNLFPQAERDSDYDKAFFRTSGWSGADGTFSVPLSDGRTVWLFGDTFIGDVSPCGKRAEGTVIVNSTIAIQKGTDPSTVEFFYGGTPEKPDSLFKPPDGRGWFWIQDAIPDRGDGKIIVFLAQIETFGEGIFGFRQCGSWTVELSIKDTDITVENYSKLSCFQMGDKEKPTTGFGAAVMAEKDWTLIYGTADYGSTKDLVLARIPSGTLPADVAWEFYTGNGWSKNMEDGVVICKGVSNELSVHRDSKGKYLLTTQKESISSDIVIFFSSTPEGPWESPLVVWHMSEADEKIFVYNPKAHPELSDEKKGLLISYNVNSFIFEDLYSDSGIYRPRFIRVHLP